MECCPKPWIDKKETDRHEKEKGTGSEAQIRARKKYREKQAYLQTRVSPAEKLAIAEPVNATKNHDFKWHRFSSDPEERVQWKFYSI